LQNVQCYNPPSGYQNKGNKAYAYTTTAGTNDTVAITNDNTILASFQATGNNPNYDPDGTKSASASGTKTSATSSSTPSNNDNTVPGISGAGAYSQSGSDPASGANSNTGGTSSLDGSSGSSPSGSGSTSFSQGIEKASEGARVVAGSLVALVAFFAAAMMM